MGRLDGKVAIVTGGGQGLGAATATLFAQEGASVAVVDRNEETSRAVAEAINGSDGRALAVTCDVRHRDQVDACIGATVDAFGPVDVLVQYAQIISIEIPFEDCSEEVFDDSWRSGCLGSIFFMQGCFPYLKERSGRIVNVASGAAFEMTEQLAAYSMAKQAIRSITRTAAKEWGRYGITVNAICPLAMTPAMSIWERDFPDHFEGMVDHVPLRRVGEPVDIARHVLSIVTDLDYCTGMTFMIDGGATGTG
jgi:NAD(P)-dependent dehydrogenase (short-subunit alcohol dehydrogenase family)